MRYDRPENNDYYEGHADGYQDGYNDGYYQGSIDGYERCLKEHNIQNTDKDLEQK